MNFGAAIINITPQRPTPNYTGVTISEGANGFRCRAAVFGETELHGILSIDTMAIDGPTVLEIRAQLKAAGVPGVWWVNATHNHLAPPITRLFLCEEQPNKNYKDQLFSWIIQAAGEACDNLEESTVRHGISAAPGFEFNRRLKGEDGVVMAFSPELPRVIEALGPVDSEVPYITFQNKSQVKGIIFSYANHNNASGIGEEHAYFDWDLGGYACEKLQNALGEECTAIFLPGAAGDIAWIDPKNPQPSSAELATHIGRSLAGNILESLPKAELQEENSVQNKTVRSYIYDRSPRASEYCEDACRGSDPKALASARNRYSAEREAVEKATATGLEIEISSISIGAGIALISLPSEVFSETGIFIRKHSPFKTTIIAELTNGYCGYVPTAEAFEQGGYETHRSVYTSRLSKDADRQLRSMAADSLERGQHDITYDSEVVRNNQ